MSGTNLCKFYKSLSDISDESLRFRSRLTDVSDESLRVRKSLSDVSNESLRIRKSLPDVSDEPLRKRKSLSDVSDAFLCILRNTSDASGGLFINMQGISVTNCAYIIIQIPLWTFYGKSFALVCKPDGITPVAVHLPLHCHSCHSI